MDPRSSRSFVESALNATTMLSPQGPSLSCFVLVPARYLMRYLGESHATLRDVALCLTS